MFAADPEVDIALFFFFMPIFYGPPLSTALGSERCGQPTKEF
jgi:hypothetical protein